MPILKIEILGSQIEIQYEEKEINKLRILIKNFKDRINQLSNNGKITNNKILILTALKAEDEILEIKSLNDKNKIDLLKIDEQKIIIEKLNHEVILLKDEIYQLNFAKSSNSKNESIAIEKINKLQKKLEIILKKIINQIDS
jgi:cell division protein ZapA (FtsZ GTPase activity inhibitor)